MLKKTIILCALFCVVFCRQQKPPKGGVTPIDALRLDFLEREDNLWDEVLLHNQNSITLDGADVSLIKQYKNFTDKLEQFFPRLSDNDNDLSILQSLWVWARVSGEMVGINGLYDLYKRFIRQPQIQDQQSGIDLAETILLDSLSSIPAAVENMVQLITENNLFEAALKESTDNICLLRQSAQQILYQLYNSIALTELRGYNMMQFSWMLLKLYNKGNFTHEAFLMRKRYEERTIITADAVRKAMAQASREYWRCDPQHHEEDDTYIQVTRLLQGYVENEVNMNTESTCKETCSYYKFTESQTCKTGTYCNRQPACNGKLLKCQYIDSDMWVCPSDPRRSNRRYEWIEYENGRHLGQVGSCARGSTKVDSWWRWLFWHCSYCLCICDEQSIKSDRFFNLRESLSDTTSNMVIVGLRFVKKNRIIHMQIQEGALLPNGNINSTSARWRPVDMYTLDDPEAKNGRDYHTLTWDKRSIDLDDLQAPEGHVLTGIRFRTVGTHLNMEIRASPINFTEGEIIDPALKSHWVSNDNTDASITLPRTKVNMYNPDVPTRSKSPSKIDSHTDQFIEFTHTDLDADAGQTTVPFLDAQETSPGTLVPLGGAGLYHKGRPGFGGFIAPKIITYDYSKHLYSEFPIIEDKVN